MLTKIGTGITLLSLVQALSACGGSASNDAALGGQGGGTSQQTGNENGGGAGEPADHNDGGDNDGGETSELACASECTACEDGFELLECESDCVCESTDAQAKADHALLLECVVDEPCAESNVSQDPGSTYWNNGDCLLSALRDRTPGRYMHTSTISDIGGTMVSYTLLLDGSDEVIVSPVSTSWGPGTEIRYDRTQRCALVSYEVLDDCLATGTDVSLTTTGGGPSLDEACAMLGDWITGCEDVEASCPAD